MRFSAKVVWITGASAGIGQAMARQFAREGAIVAASARRVDRLHELAGEIERAGGSAQVVPCDVTDDASVGAAVERVVGEQGRLDVAVANAGFSVDGRIAELPDEDWRRQYDTNVFGLLSTIRHAMPHLRDAEGRMALIASVAAFVPFPKAGAYSSSKAAVAAIGETLSAELAGTPVTCTTIHPGFVSSELPQIDRHGRFRPEWEDRRPAQLMWEAEDAARVMVRAIHRRKREFVFTGHGRFSVWAARHFHGLTRQIVERSGRPSDKG